MSGQQKGLVQRPCPEPGDRFAVGLSINAIQNRGKQMADAFESPELRLMRALVADDDAVGRMLVASLLGRHGYIVDTAIDGVEAVEAVLRRHFDVLILDLQMPLLNGLDAARRIR